VNAGGTPPATFAPPAPAVIAQHFPAAAPLLVRYADWLADAGIVRGLLGPREVARLWDRHLLNSVALAELLPPGVRLVDVGSGAGLPGIALACARPDLEIDLIEPLLRRSDFLSEVVADLDLAQRVRVWRGRSEDKAVVRSVGRASFVTARAVAPLDRLARWTMPLLVRGGSLLALKGGSAEAEIAQYRDAISSAGADIVGVVECGAEFVDPPVRVVHLQRR
jgi:16S rRNA (guanine527-N7)-methyltransferase